MKNPLFCAPVLNFLPTKRQVNHGQHGWKTFSELLLLQTPTRCVFPRTKQEKLNTIIILFDLYLSLGLNKPIHHQLRLWSTPLFLPWRNSKSPKCLLLNEFYVRLEKIVTTRCTDTPWWKCRGLWLVYLGPCFGFSQFSGQQQRRYIMKKTFKLVRWHSKIAKMHLLVEAP